MPSARRPWLRFVVDRVGVVDAFAVAFALSIVAWGLSQPGSSVAVAGSEVCALAVPSPIAQRIRELDSDDWRVRERATRALVEDRDQWLRRVPVDWQPEGVEARWRWQWILERVGRLERLANWLDSSDERVPWLLGSLRAEVGNALTARLIDLARDHAIERVRERALAYAFDDPAVDVDRVSFAADDPSAWVRRRYYDGVARRAPERLRTEIIAALEAATNDVLCAEAVRAIRIHGLFDLLPRARRLWRNARPTLRVELGRLLSARPRIHDVDVYFWMAESADYRVVLSGLRAIEGCVASADVATKQRVVGRLIRTVIDSSMPELQLRVRRVIERDGDRSLATDLVAELDSADPARRHFAIETLLSWHAIDYYAEIRAAVVALPKDERRALPLPASFRE